MSFRAIATSLSVFLAAALWLSRSGESVATDATRLTNSAEALAHMPYSNQLAQHIATQQEIIMRTQALLDRLEAPEPIYATERSALPVNSRELAEYTADFNEYSATITAAKMQLRALQQQAATREAEP